MGIIQMIAAAGGLNQYLIDKSLRFNDDDTPYLNRTPSSSTTNQKQFTFSFWAKPTSTGAVRSFFSCGAGSLVTGMFQMWLESGRFIIYSYGDGYYRTDKYFRDPSAWYHFVVAVDSTLATASDRWKLWVNGVRVTDWFTETHPAQDKTWIVNTTTNHEISGIRNNAGTQNGYWDGYLAEYYIIDGQAKTAADFGETNADTGQWIPKEYSGSYGTNGFYLNFDGDGKNYTSEISGSEQTPATYPKEKMFDGNPATAYLVGDSSTATWTPVGGLTFDSTLKLRAYHTTTNTSNSDVTFNWSGGSYTLVIDDVNAVKYYDVSSNVTSPVTSVTWTTDAASAGPYIYGVEVDGKVLVDRTGIESDSSGNDNHWTANNLTLPGEQKITTNYPTGSSGTIYDFKDAVAALENDLTSGTYAAFKAFDGNAGTIGLIGQVIFQGTKPTFTNAGGGVEMKSAGNGITCAVNEGTQVACTDNVWTKISGTSDGDLTSLNVYNNTTGQSYFYSVRVDGVEIRVQRYADEVTSDVDVSTDTPTPFDDEGNGTGNYCTWNPLDNGNPSAPGIVTLAQGNLKVTGSSTDATAQAIWGTFGMSGGKYYWEIKRVSGTAAYTLLGIDSGPMVSSDINQSPTAYTVKETTGLKYNNSTSAAYDAAATWANGDTISMAFDADTGTLWYAKNGTWMNSATTAEIEAGTTTNAAWTGLSGTFRPVIGFYYADEVHEANFGASSFAYTPPTGFKGLNTFNLDAPTIEDPSKHFDIATDTGPNILTTALGLTDGADFVWIKDRDNASTDHILFNRINDSDMDGDPHLRSNEPDDEVDCGAYTAPTGNSVAWVWNAGSANVTKSAGDLNGSVYDQSDTWTDDVTGTPHNNDAANYGPDHIFDGINTTYAQPASGESNGYQWTPSGGYSFSGALEIEGYFYSPQGTTVVSIVHGGGTTDVASQFNQAGALTINTITGITSPITSIKYYFTNANDYCSFTRIWIGGKLLLDPTISVTNVPTIASTYRANPTAGFSIVTYEGTNTDHQSFAHGLNTAPGFILIKNRDTNYAWAVWHKNLALGKYLILNSSGAISDWPQFNDQYPDSNVVYVGSSGSTNYESHVAYCWSEVEGYSKFGTWTGNQDTDGPFVWCGFKPAYILLKCSSHAEEWIILDNKRDTYNEVEKGIYGSLPNAEDSGGFVDTDFLSNGFKLRADGSIINGPAKTYIFAAFAETPFKYSNAR